MKKLFIVLAVALGLSACGPTTTLYYWGGDQNKTTKYENLAYLNYDKQTPQSICKLVCVYEDMVTKPGGAKNVPPPGICAEYGYLLLLPETSETFENKATAGQKRTFSRKDYSSFFPEYGIILLQKEIEFYPESAIFINPLIEKFRN